MPDNLPRNNMVAKENTLGMRETDRNAGSVGVEKKVPTFDDLIIKRSRPSGTTYALRAEGRRQATQLWDKYGESAIDGLRKKAANSTKPEEKIAYDLLVRSLKGKERYESNAVRLGELQASNSPWNEVLDDMVEAGFTNKVFAFTYVDKLRRDVAQAVVGHSEVPIGKETDQIIALVDTEVANVISGYLANSAVIRSQESDDKLLSRFLEDPESSSIQQAKGKFNNVAQKALAWTFDREYSSLEEYIADKVPEAMAELAKIDAIRAHDVREVKSSMSRRTFLNRAGAIASLLAINTASGGSLGKMLRAAIAVDSKPQEKVVAKATQRKAWGWGKRTEKPVGSSESNADPVEVKQVAKKPETVVNAPDHIEGLINPDYRIGMISLEQPLTITFPMALIDKAGLTIDWIKNNLLEFASFNEGTGEVSFTLDINAVQGAEYPAELLENFADSNGFPSLAATTASHVARTNFLFAHSGQIKTGWSLKEMLPFFLLERAYQEQRSTTSFTGMVFRLNQQRNGTNFQESILVENIFKRQIGDFDNNVADYPDDDKPFFYRLDDMDIAPEDDGVDRLYLTTCHNLDSQRRGGDKDMLLWQARLVSEPSTIREPKKEIEPGLQMYADYIIDDSNDPESPYGKAYREDESFTETAVSKHENRFLKETLTSDKAIRIIQELRPEMDSRTKAWNYLNNIAIVQGSAIDTYMRELRQNSEGTTPMSIDAGGEIHFKRLAFRSDAQLDESFVLEELIQMLQYENTVAANQDYLATVGLGTPEGIMKEVTDGNLRAYLELIQQKYKREQDLTHNPYYFRIGTTVYNEEGLDHPETVDAPFTELVNILQADGETYSARQLMNPEIFARANESFRSREGYNVWDVVALDRSEGPVVQAKRNINIETISPEAN